MHGTSIHPPFHPHTRTHIATHPCHQLTLVDALLVDELHLQLLFQLVALFFRCRSFMVSKARQGKASTMPVVSTDRSPIILSNRQTDRQCPIHYDTPRRGRGSGWPSSPRPRGRSAAPGRAGWYWPPRARPPASRSVGLGWTGRGREYHDVSIGRRWRRGTGCGYANEREYDSVSTKSTCVYARATWLLCTYANINRSKSTCVPMRAIWLLGVYAHNGPRSPRASAPGHPAAGGAPVDSFSFMHACMTMEEGDDVLQ